MSDYINIKRKVYGNAYFLPVCEKCGRFVKADKSIWLNKFGQVYDKKVKRILKSTNNDISIEKQTNCKCSKCGRSNMLFEGYY